MQNKDSLRKKYYSIRKKKYYDIKPDFFNPLLKIIKTSYYKKNINLSSYYPCSFEVNVLKLFKKNLQKNIKILLPSLISLTAKAASRSNCSTKLKPHWAWNAHQ